MANEREALKSRERWIARQLLYFLRLEREREEKGVQNSGMTQPKDYRGMTHLTRSRHALTYVTSITF